MRYFPFFHRNTERVLSYPVKEYPKVYNKNGNPLEFFYLQDQIMATYSKSQYFMWDRCNYGLDVHFYSHNNMLSTKGTPIHKYGILVESKQIVPDNYKIFDRYKGLEKEFDSIFTYDAELLNKLPNTKFFPSCAEVWYGKNEDGHIWDDQCYRKKTKGISILSSDKEMCDMHKLRIEVSRYCKKTGIADAYGTFDGGHYCLVDDTLREYRYSIIIENDISDYFYTEKITNCFASQTIPIYMGASQIDQFFNMDGIINIEKDDLDHLDVFLEQCTEKYYEEHLPAILDNYERVSRYKNIYDWLYESYFQ